MSGPHPVVSIATKFSYCRRRRTNQTYIFIYFLYKQKILVSIKKWFYACKIFSVFRCFNFNHLDLARNFFLAFLLTHLIVYIGKNFIGNILHTFQKSYGKSRIWQFFAFIHCPKAIGQVIVFNGTVPLNAAKTTVMIGYKQALIGNQLSSTSTAKNHYGIF